MLAGEFETLSQQLTAPLPPGYRSEMGLAAGAWVRELGTRLERGMLLLVDYGYPAPEYYHPQRSMGTLRCHYRHRAHDDPFLWPGLQDISVHVDFSRVAAAGRGAGLEVVGFTSQAAFLMGSGLLELAAGVPPGTPEYARLTHEIKRLTLPGEMGEAVKVVALGRGDLPALSGFSERDWRSRL